MDNMKEVIEVVIEAPDLSTTGNWGDKEKFETGLCLATSWNC